jgi:tetratricopeptide (TPR) repeat protein
MMNSDSSVPDYDDNLSCYEGEILLMEGALMEAADKFIQAIQMDQNSARAHAGLGRALYQQYISFAKNFADVSKKGIAFEIQTLTPVINLIEQTIEEMELAAKLGIKSDDFFYELGDIYLRKGDADNAEKQLLLGLNINPKHRNLLFRLGECYFLQEKYTNAFEYWQRALEIDSKNAEILYQLSRIYYLQDEKTKAVQCLEKTIAINPNFSEALFALGVCFLETDRQSQAIDVFRRFATLEPTSTEAQWLRTKFPNL